VRTGELGQGTAGNCRELRELRELGHEGTAGELQGNCRGTGSGLTIDIIAHQFPYNCPNSTVGLSSNPTLTFYRTFYICISRIHSLCRFNHGRRTA